MIVTSREGLNDRHYNKLEIVFLELESESATTLPRDEDVGVSIIVNGKVTQVWEGRDLLEVKVGSLLLITFLGTILVRECKGIILRIKCILLV